MADRILRIVVTLVALLASSPTYASSCEDDDLQSKSNDGSYLFMLSGAVYEVLAGDVIDSSLWLPPSEVVICSRVVSYRGDKYTIYDIVNKDENEKVSAIKRR
ncbi:hypothetical protein WS62_24150 [Burkholderia sp. ABCPW 14]|uniref:Lipoprotein n=1 Tax=Burkholderia mayonis TaxID=1385591 RepID=A0A1B4G6W6_9BURK|nr:MULTISPECIES: hypothetical protein [Burkholderia]AOJ11673.1 hypothetical protein WS71_32045 [Burkholderia mayonis]KVD81680.1 hypothetical protein WS62_24150 [Burkholderia sp. ABCPW 14]KVE54578.1 hypothetical protein WS71_03905 [Burkholderia mayonis]